MATPRPAARAVLEEAELGLAEQAALEILRQLRPLKATTVVLELLLIPNTVEAVVAAQVP